jgi:Domain of Unknown Function (DUF1599).
MDTSEQFKSVVARCRKLYNDKMVDYGPAWRILRTSSLTDQIYIKANRIRSIQTKKEQLVEDDIDSDFMGILNYSAMAIIQIQLGVVDNPDIDASKADELFVKVTNEAYKLMMRKNHDYDEAWRSMRISSITDLILMKLLRIKAIEDHQGKTIVSEGLDANYYDIINYAAFALILMSE